MPDDVQPGLAPPESEPAGMPQAWVGTVRALVEPVLDAADVGFAWNTGFAWRDGVHGCLLWEADPAAFFACYEPGAQPDPDDPCVDWWVYLEEPGRMRLELDVGTTPVSEVLPLTGDGDVDGAAVARRFATLLHVPDAQDTAAGGGGHG